MVFNEEVQKGIRRCYARAKTVKRIPKVARPSELLGGSSEQTECIQKLPVARSTE